MKHDRILAGLLLSLSLLRLPAQGVEEKFKRLSADIESLRAANQLLVEKLSTLTDELQHVRAEQARHAASAIGREDLKPLAQRIEEVDKRRQEDKDTISEEIKKSEARLVKSLTTPAQISPKPPIKPAPNVPPAAEDGFTYPIKDGDRLGDIVSAYNDTFKSKGMKTITKRQVMDANPDVDWTKLKIGQKIVIPHPAD